MPRTSKGARLVWRDESRKADGSLRSKAGWFIRDGKTFISGCGGTGDRQQAEIKLAEYITEKYQPARDRGRDPDQVTVADVAGVYLTDIAPKHARPKETAARLEHIIRFFGDYAVDQINGDLCRKYANQRVTSAAARRELEDLRAAFQHYRKEGYCTSAPAVVLPEKPQARERWLTRSEAARLLWAAWRMKQTWKGQESDRRTGRHIARFILVALYTGTRSAAICGAAIRPTDGHGYVDLDRGVFYRRWSGARKTKKQQPPVRLPDRLLAHLRRWSETELEIKTKGRGKSGNIGRKISEDYVVEWNGKPVGSVTKGFRSAVTAAKLSADVTPHILRHTAATWLMMNGTEIWQAAGFLGMTPETLINNYGHHHPDYQADAANAITAKRAQTRPTTNVLQLRERRA